MRWTLDTRERASGGQFFAIFDAKLIQAKPAQQQRSDQAEQWWASSFRTGSPAMALPLPECRQRPCRRPSTRAPTLTEAAAAFPGGCIVHVVVFCAGMNGSAVRSASDGHWRNPPLPPGASRVRGGYHIEYMMNTGHKKLATLVFLRCSSPNWSAPNIETLRARSHLPRSR